MWEAPGKVAGQYIDNRPSQASVAVDFANSTKENPVDFNGDPITYEQICTIHNRYVSPVMDNVNCVCDSTNNYRAYSWGPSALDEAGLLYKEPWKQFVGTDVYYFMEKLFEYTGERTTTIKYPGWPIYAYKHKEPPLPVHGYYGYDEDEALDGIFQYTLDYGYIIGYIDIRPSVGDYFFGASELYDIDEWENSSTAHIYDSEGKFIGDKKVDMQLVLYHGRGACRIVGAKSVKHSCVVDANIDFNDIELDYAVILGNKIYNATVRDDPAQPIEIEYIDYNDFAVSFDGDIVYQPVPEPPKSFIRSTCIRQESDIHVGCLQVRDSDVKITAAQANKIILSKVEGEVTVNDSCKLVNISGADMVLNGYIEIINTTDVVEMSKVEINVQGAGRAQLVNCVYPNYEWTLNVTFTNSPDPKPTNTYYYPGHNRVRVPKAIVKNLLFAPGQPDQTWSGTVCTLEVELNEYMDLASLGIPTNGLKPILYPVGPGNAWSSIEVTKEHDYGKLFGLASGFGGYHNGAEIISTPDLGAPIEGAPCVEMKKVD
jgi:hypothetical protein